MEQKKEFINNVQVYLELEGWDKDEWKREQLRYIQSKMTGLIGHITQADGCGTAEAGRWSKGWKERMKYGWKYFEKGPPPLDAINEENVETSIDRSADRARRVQAKREVGRRRAAALLGEQYAPGPAQRTGSNTATRGAVDALFRLHKQAIAEQIRRIPESNEPVALATTAEGEQIWDVSNSGKYITQFNSSAQAKFIPKGKRNTVRKKATEINERVAVGKKQKQEAAAKAAREQQEAVARAERERQEAAARAAREQQVAAAAAAKKAAENAAQRQREDEVVRQAWARWDKYNPLGKDRATGLSFYGRFNDGRYIYAFSGEQEVTRADEAKRILQWLEEEAAEARRQEAEAERAARNEAALQAAWNLWQENGIAGRVRGLPYYGRYSDGSYIFGFRANQSEILDEGEARQEMERLQREAAEEARRQKEEAAEARRQEAEERRREQEERRQEAAERRREQQAEERRQEAAERRREQAAAAAARGKSGRRAKQDIPYTAEQQFARRQNVQKVAPRRGIYGQVSKEHQNAAAAQSARFRAEVPEQNFYEEEENNNESNSGSNSENNNAAEERGRLAREAAEKVPAAPARRFVRPQVTQEQLDAARETTFQAQAPVLKKLASQNPAVQRLKAKAAAAKGAPGVGPGENLGLLPYESDSEGGHLQKKLTRKRRHRRVSHKGSKLQLSKTRKNKKLRRTHKHQKKN